MVHNCKVSYEEARSMPVVVRRWWIERMSEQLRKEAEARDKAASKPPR